MLATEEGARELQERLERCLENKKGAPRRELGTASFDKLRRREKGPNVVRQEERLRRCRQ